MSESDTHPLDRLGKTGRTYAIPELRLVYISTAKNACTSIKWMMADLAGEDPARFLPALGNSTNRSDGIHQRDRWEHVRRLRELPPEVRYSISPENDWMVFSVTRDPRARLFSAWQNKYLLRNPGYIDRFDRPWMPRLPESQEQIIEDFAMFVEEISTARDHEVFVGDAHFLGQTLLLMEDRVPYSRIYEISELGELIDDVTGHVRRYGFEGEISLRRENDTPLRAIGPAFDNGVRAQVEKIYADDFARFGDRWDFDKIAARTSWSDEAIAHARSLTEANLRIGDLVVRGRELQTTNRRLRRRLRQTRDLAQARTVRGRLSAVKRRLVRATAPGETPAGTPQDL